ncbi:hypothetical protein FRB93_009969 [Tulasnella sp. JGI-2019a]|nr:hypothetical protein FRB93_009969 [Tulasnella sp. JGI-2019a]
MEDNTNGNVSESLYRAILANIAQSPELELPVPIPNIHVQIDDNAPLQSLLGLVNSILEIYKTVTFNRHEWQHICQQLISYTSALIPFATPTQIELLSKDFGPLIDIISRIHSELMKQYSSGFFEQSLKKEQYCEDILSLSRTLNEVAIDVLNKERTKTRDSLKNHRHCPSETQDVMKYKLPAKFDEDGLRILEQAEVAILRVAPSMSGFLNGSSEAAIDGQKVFVKFYPESKGASRLFQQHVSMLRQIQFGGKHVLYGYSTPNSPRPFLVFPSDASTGFLDFLSPSFGSSDVGLLENQDSSSSSHSQQQVPTSYDLTKRIRISSSGDPLARGVMSDVFRGELEGELGETQLVAIKTHRWDYEEVAYAPSAPRVYKLVKQQTDTCKKLAALRHKNIVPMLGYTTAFGDYRIAFVIPWYANGTLDLYIRKNTQADKHQLLLDISQGLAYLHSLDPPFVHGAMEPSCIFVNNEGTALIGGLDYAETLRVFETDDYGVTPYGGGDLRRMAPELFKDQPTSPASDVYTLAMIGVEIHSGKRPFYSKSRNKVIQHVTDGSHPLRSDHPEIDDSSWALFERCWAKDLNARPTAQDVSRELVQQTMDNIKRFQVYDLTNRVSKESVLGFGGYSIVYNGLMDDDGNKKKVILKELQARGMTSEEEDDEEALRVRLYKRLYRELSFGIDLKHQNIYRLLGFALLDLPCLVSPFYEGRELSRYIRKLSHLDRWSMLIGVARGLAYLHTHDPPIIHCDLKAANVLVDNEGNPAISDFGTSKKLWTTPSALATENVGSGSLRWRAPELLLEGSNDATTHSDVYSFSCLVLEVMTGKVPFYNYNDMKVNMAILTGKHPIAKDYPELSTQSPLWTLMNRCWEQTPSQRPSIQDIVQELEQLKPVA